MDFESSDQYITYRELLEFGCLIPSLLEEIKNEKPTYKIVKKNIKPKEKRAKQSLEERKQKNLIAAKNCRIHKKIFKELLEEKVIQFREKYEHLTGKKYVIPEFESENDFTLYPGLSKKERNCIIARKCRYNKKMRIIYLEKELKQLQREVTKLS